MTSPEFRIQRDLTDERWTQKYCPLWVSARFTFRQGIPHEHIASESNRTYYVSPRLQENPNAKLDLMTECEEYLYQLEPGYKKVVDAHYEQMQTFARMPGRDLKVIGQTAVDVINDADKLEHRIKLLLDQTMPTNEWFWVFNLNGSGDPELVEQKMLECLRLIVSAQTHHKAPFGMILLDNSDMVIGSLRKLGYDVLAQAVSDSNTRHDVVAISDDVDAIKTPKDYIERFWQKSVEHHDKDFFTNYLKWEPIGPYGSDANKAMMYWEFVMLSIMNNIGRYSLADGNTAFRFATYLGTGGHKPVDSMETITMAEFAAFARNGGSFRGYSNSRAMLDQLVHFDKHSYLRTNSRRIKDALQAGANPNEAWIKMQFSTGDDPVRIGNRELTNQIDLVKICDQLDKNLYNLCPDKARLDRTTTAARKIIRIPVD